MDTKQLEADVLMILRRDHPQYEWWARLGSDHSGLTVSIQATRLGVKEYMGYGADTRPQFWTAEFIAGHLDNLLYHLDGKTVPVIQALKAAGELRADYPEYCYQTPEWIAEMEALQNAQTERYGASIFTAAAPDKPSLPRAQ